MLVSILLSTNLYRPVDRHGPSVGRLGRLASCAVPLLYYTTYRLDSRGS